MVDLAVYEKAEHKVLASPRMGPLINDEDRCPSPDGLGAIGVIGDLNFL